MRTAGLLAEMEADGPLWAGILEPPALSQRDGWGARTRMKDASSTDVIVHHGVALTTFYQCGDAYRLDPETLAFITERSPVSPYRPFRWRDGELDALERKLHAGLDAWGKEHYIRSLNGLRSDDDKKNVTQWIEQIRNDPQRYGG